jgi:hypothetical protein
MSKVIGVPKRLLALIVSILFAIVARLSYTARHGRPNSAMINSSGHEITFIFQGLKPSLRALLPHGPVGGAACTQPQKYYSLKLASYSPYLKFNTLGGEDYRKLYKTVQAGGCIGHYMTLDAEVPCDNIGQPNECYTSMAYSDPSALYEWGYQFGAPACASKCPSQNICIYPPSCPPSSCPPSSCPPSSCPPSSCPPSSCPPSSCPPGSCPPGSCPPGGCDFGPCDLPPQSV